MFDINTDFSSEVWSIIPFAKNYRISTFGRVMSLNYRCTGIPTIRRVDGVNGHGYHHLILSEKKKKSTVTIHKLVATAFIPNPLNKKYVNHIDGDKTNNNVWNLEWCTAEENMQHAFNTGLCKNKLENHSLAKLKNTDVLRIRELLAIGELTQTEIALMYGVTKGVINHIHKKRQWVSL